MSAYARSTDPQSSHDAAASIDTTRLQQLVIDCLLRNQKPMSSIQIAADLGIHLVSISPRMRPLENAGKIICVGSLPALNSSGKIRNLRHYVLAEVQNPPAEVAEVAF